MSREAKLAQSDAFSTDIPTRLAASARIGAQVYANAPLKFQSVEERGKFLESGWRAIQHELDPIRVRAATNPRVLSYGAWNPLVMFIGLSPGIQPVSTPREFEHMIGCPVLFKRWKGARGNPWFPEVVADIASDAVMKRAEADTRLRSLIEDDNIAFQRAADSTALIMNLSPIPTPAGDVAPMEWVHAYDDFLLHITAFQPRVLVAVKPDVTRALRRIIPEYTPRIPRGEMPEVDIISNRDLHIPIISMPVHPNALGDGFRRLAESRPYVIDRIAEFLI